VLAPAVVKFDIRRLVGERLAAVEAMYREHMASPLAVVDEVGTYVADGEGKRVRPTLHLLSANLVGYEGPHDVLLATVLEYIHTATLVHDDIIDGAEVRRGRPAVHARWGADVTVLFGDWMFAKAMDLALRAESLEVMQSLADVTLRMTEGEMLQTRYVGRLDLSVDEHLDMVERKTAALFACCCEVAAILARSDARRREALREFGRNLGLAFQLVDDLLDFTGDPRRLGKPAASDLKEGKATLPVLDLLAGGSSADGALVRGIADGSAASERDVDALRARLTASGALDRSRRMAEQYAAAARAALEPFPEGPARRALEGLPDLLVTRDH